MFSAGFFFFAKQISVSTKKSDLYIRFEVFILDRKESQKWWTIETRWKESLELFGLLSAWEQGKYFAGQNCGYAQRVQRPRTERTG